LLEGGADDLRSYRSQHPEGKEFRMGEGEEQVAEDLEGRL